MSPILILTYLLNQNWRLNLLISLLNILLWYLDILLLDLLKCRPFLDHLSVWFHHYLPHQNINVRVQIIKCSLCNIININFTEINLWKVTVFLQNHFYQFFSFLIWRNWDLYWTVNRWEEIFVFNFPWFVCRINNRRKIIFSVEIFYQCFSYAVNNNLLFTFAYSERSFSHS